MNRNILISCAGRRVSLTNAFKTELELFFPEAMVFASDSNPNWSAACQVADGNIKVPSINDPSYIDNLIDECAFRKIGLIIPTLDTELLLLSKNREKFKSAGIEISVSEYEFIETCRDKRKSSTFFEQSSIEVPIIYNKNQYQLPLYIKPYDGSLSANNHIVRTQDEMLTSYVNDDKLIFMELIDRQAFDEYTIDMYYDLNGILKCLVPRKRLEVRGGEISKGVTQRNVVYDELKTKMHHIKGARGCLTTQVFFNETKKSIVGIEINPRFGGGYPLSYMAGANYPAWLIQEYFMQEQLSFFENWKRNLVMLRYDAEVIVNG